MRKPKSTATRTAVTPVSARPRARRSLEGVVAGYLHDISQRHRRTVSPPPRRLLGATSR
jgi:hypothetical protein